MIRRALTRLLLGVNAILLLIALSLGWQMGQVFQINPSAIVPELLAVAGVSPKPDDLTSKQWWQDEMQYRTRISQGQTYNICLFGDSISSALGNTLGDRTFNFAIGGMSSVSLIPQMQNLVAASTRCQQVIFAIGTNDACYAITNDQFVANMRQAIALAHKLTATRIIVLPAFYSTLAASRKIFLAGTLQRVEEISALLEKVAIQEQVTMMTQGLESLYQGQELRANLTADGVHLNATGRILYRNALMKILYSPSS
jgi:lysophospholipase L1-like esterase